jgi:tRNA threonylcarbamoyladenosine biosynthesis protein TsaE
MSARRLTEAQLRDEAARWGRDLPQGAVVWLVGDLGAGKTTFAHAFARGRGVEGEVTSPTFALVHRYEGPRGVIHHVDCFRLRSPDEAADLDWRTLTGGDALVVEWPERAGAWVPPPTLRVTLHHVPNVDQREVAIESATPTP